MACGRTLGARRALASPANAGAVRGAQLSSKGWPELWAGTVFATVADPMETATTSRLPLQRYRLFESHDMDEARESVARVFCPHGLVMLRPRTAITT